MRKFTIGLICFAAGAAAAVAIDVATDGKVVEVIKNIGCKTVEVAQDATEVVADGIGEMGDVFEQ